MDSSDVTGAVNGIVGPIIIGGLGLYGLKLFGDMAENFANSGRMNTKKKQKNNIWDYDFFNDNYSKPKKGKKNMGYWNWEF